MTHLQIIVYPEGNGYVAQCLEIDVATQAKSIPELMASLGRVFSGYAELDLHEDDEALSSLKLPPRELGTILHAK